MNVGEMQRKLSQWAEQRLEDGKMGLFASRKDLRLHDLYHLLHDESWLRLAYEYVSQNSGSRTAGCDGLDMKRFNQNLEHNLQTLREQLRTQTFQPHPVRRVYIPKANGKRRPLGIPSIRDRIVQEALRMVLEPIFEVEFYRDSYGFRPNRRTADALARISGMATASGRFYWVIEGDIQSYFDTINHDVLMTLLRRRIRDRKLLRLVWRFLKAGVMEGRLFQTTEQGTPQGGIVSPLLANVYLHELDMFLSRWTDLSEADKRSRRDRGAGNFVHIRYADDFVVLTNGRRREAEQMRARIHEFLTDRLRLTLSWEKTKITHIDDGFTFLGYDIRRDVTGTGRKHPKFLIPTVAVRRARHTIQRITSPTTTAPSVHAKFVALNRYLRGWANYYRYAYNASWTFSRLDHFVYQHMIRWLARKYRCKLKQIIRRYNRRVDGVVTLATARIALWRMSSLKPRPLRARTFGNPYELPHADVIREFLIDTETVWYGDERRPGMADLRLLRLKHDLWTCQSCGRRVTESEAEVDHIRPVRRFKRPIDANVLGNLETLCLECHRTKGESDRRRESRMQ